VAPAAPVAPVAPVTPSSFVSTVKFQFVVPAPVVPAGEVIANT
jgi:hypothetical protein